MLIPEAAARRLADRYLQARAAIDANCVADELGG